MVFEIFVSASPTNQQLYASLWALCFHVLTLWLMIPFRGLQRRGIFAYLPLSRVESGRLTWRFMGLSKYGYKYLIGF